LAASRISNDMGSILRLYVMGCNQLDKGGKMQL